MSTMVCGRCGKVGIYWVGLASLMPSTYCPHCEGVDCQVMDQSLPIEETEEEEE